MSEQPVPAAVGSSAELGLVPERAAFEAEMAKRGYHTPPALYRDGSYRDTCYAAGWEMWQAAVAAERERCAKLCEWLPIGTGLQGKTFAEAIRGEGTGVKMAEGFRA